jgi:hypothetical protein
MEESYERADWADYSWQSVYFGGCALLHSIDNDRDAAEKLAYFASCHMNATNGIKRTNCGLTFVSEWGSCRHAAGAAAIIAYYARHIAASNREQAAAALQFASRQARLHLCGCQRPLA